MWNQDWFCLISFLTQYGRLKKRPFDVDQKKVVEGEIETIASGHDLVQKLVGFFLTQGCKVDKYQDRS